MFTVRLLVERGNLREREYTLYAEATLVGRHGECALRIPSAEVSRRHCKLRVGDGILVVEDLGSLNGTFLNGERIHAPAAVRPGDRLEIGPASFLVQYELSEEAARRFAPAAPDLSAEATHDLSLETIDADQAKALREMLERSEPASVPRSDPVDA
jgi:pSer/pThr/pTyr-binding forkhead associated (FHA) protein